MSETSSGGPHERTIGRWYSVTRDGLACLCLDEDNAREMAAQCDRDYPKHAPHTAMMLGDVTALCAEVETLRNVVDMTNEAPEIRRLNRINAELLDAMAELVELKAMQDEMSHMLLREEGGMGLDYDRRKPLAWQRARELVGSNA